MGVSGTARGVAAGFEAAATFGLTPSIAGLAGGLTAYVPIDGGGAASVAAVASPASVGGVGVYVTGMPATDRDGFEGGAAAFSPTHHLQLSAELEAALDAAIAAGATVMAWIRLDVDSVRAHLVTAAAAAAAAETDPEIVAAAVAAAEAEMDASMVGGWRHDARRVIPSATS